MDRAEDYIDNLEKQLPGVKTRLDFLSLQYGEDLADAVHEGLLFYIGADPNEETMTGGTRKEDFVRAAMYSMDVEWLVAEIARMRGG